MKVFEHQHSDEIEVIPYPLRTPMLLVMHPTLQVKTAKYIHAVDTE